MNQKEFDQLLKSSTWFQQIIAELAARTKETTKASEQAISMIATAAARQMDAAVFAQNLERMEQMFDQADPNAIRSEMIRTAISLVLNSGKTATQSH